MVLTISKQTQARFILGKQGLYPGRRWRGKAGVAQAMQAGVVVQVDPLNMSARSHDLTLHSRVLGYSPALLEEHLYADRGGFDYGGVLMAHPMEHLPYWRAVMEQHRASERTQHFLKENSELVEDILATIRENGPLGNRNFSSAPTTRRYWRSGKLSGQALYLLWMSGELMTHSRAGFQRLYDLRERIAPPEFNRVAAAAEAEDFFARQALRELGLANMKSWRGWFMGLAGVKISMEEGARRLAELEEQGWAAHVLLEGDPSTPCYLPAPDLPLLEVVHAGHVPDEWQPLVSSTQEEAVFLAPLDIVSARGRALPLFDFEYVWEVYKPRELRRWGYYVLPILVGDRLVARLDPALDRKTRTLAIRGLWYEDGAQQDAQVQRALQAGLERFRQFVGAEQVVWDEFVKEAGQNG